MNILMLLILIIHEQGLLYYNFIVRCLNVFVATVNGISLASSFSPMALFAYTKAVDFFVC